METERRIVVGVNGSASAKAALHWAVEQAELTGAMVSAVMAWKLPPFYGLVCSWEGQPVPPGGFEEDARLVLRGTVGEVERTAAAKIHIRPDLRCGRPAQVLLEAAEGAELLVLGSRGRSGIYDALLGSVRQRCTARSRCPVVVVRSGAATSQS